MEDNLAKENFSYSYVSAIASIAKFSTYKPTVDDESVDIGFCKKGGNGSIRSPRLEAQLKCTSSNIRKTDALHFPLPKKNYDDLRIENIHVPRILIVVLIHENIKESLEHLHEEGLVLKKCGYWLSLRGFPESTNQNTVTVEIPRKNVFSVDAISNIMEKIGVGCSI